MGFILARKEFSENGNNFVIHVEGGLHYIKGNEKPYFTITATIKEKFKNGRYRDYMGGCCHDQIEKHFPKIFSDLISLHLSDIEGIPMHCSENGSYWLGFSKYQAPDFDKAAKHFRLSIDQIKSLYMQFIKKCDVEAWAPTQYARYKREAQNCIKRHTLQIFGDTWAPL